ncbi:hypothetical protein F4678DRAFT_457130 [Xylaria arbuscula]|nr:hypothetical protein F4678DRAFT_457130 [Xylaria arbuscula]
MGVGNVIGTEPGLAIVLLEVDWFPWFGPEFVPEDTAMELTITPEVSGIEVTPLVAENGDVVIVDRFVNVRLPVADTLLSDMVLTDVGDNVTFDGPADVSGGTFEVSLKTVPDTEPDEILAEVVNSTEDTTELSPKPVELTGPVVAELLLPVEMLVASVIVILGDIEDISETEFKMLLEDTIEDELPLRFDTVPVVAKLGAALEGNGETEMATLFVNVLPVELVLGNKLVKG